MKGGNVKLAGKKQSRIYKALPKYMRQKARRVNKLLNTWTASGLTSNDLEMVQDMLSNFYESVGKTVKDSQIASENIKLKRSEKEEYNRILDFILYNDEVDLNKRTMQNQKIRETWNDINESTYEKVKAQYEQVFDEQSFIDFVDRMNKTKNNRMLSILLDSHQFAGAYELGINKGFKESEVDKIIMEEYNKKGITYDDLYEHILKILNKKKRVNK